MGQVVFFEAPFIGSILDPFIENKTLPSECIRKQFLYEVSSNEVSNDADRIYGARMYTLEKYVCQFLWSLFCGA